MIKSKLTQISLLRTIGSISFFSFLLFSCELFTPDEDSDLWKKLDNDIAWDNASRLTVTVAYPQEWGASPQYGRNRCYDIARTSQLARAGFAFEVEFTPDILYSVQRWRAYKTSDITREALGGDWLQDQSLLNNNNVQELKDVKFPNLRGRGGKGNFIINTTEPVTLIPWCRAEPYVIKTEPQTSSIPDPGEQWVYDFTQPIKIYFNEALDPDTDWRFEKPEESAEGEENIGIVWIRARSNSSENFEDKTGWFKTTMEYESKDGEHILTIYPNTVDGGIKAGWQIEVTIGPNIKNIRGVNMSRPEVLYYGTTEDSVATILSWRAEYDPDDNTITVTVGTQNNAGTPEAWYEVNRGQRLTLALSDNGVGTIHSVSRLNASGIRQGRSTSGVQEYSIFIDVATQEGFKASSAEIKIWNIGTPGEKDSGMSVSNTNPAIEITHERQIAMINEQLAMLGEGTEKKPRNFVLTRNLTLTNHTPIGTEEKPFTDNFYGNGHTITITGFDSSISGGVVGFFGVVDGVEGYGGGVVRDLTVEYVNPQREMYRTIAFGGIAGQATGKAQLRNVLVTGGFHLDMQGDDSSLDNRHIYAGGITGVLGHMPVFLGDPPDLSYSEASIQNAYSSLDLEVKRESKEYVFEDSYDVRVVVGGIIGTMGRLDLNDGGGIGDHVVAKDISVVGNITVGSDSKRVSTTNAGGVFVGGLAGTVTGNGVEKKAELLNCDYRNGNIDVYNRTGLLAVGAAVGRLVSNAKIRDCISRGGGKTSKSYWGNSFSVGGFVGEIFHLGKVTIENCYGEYLIDAKGENHLQEGDSGGGTAGASTMIPPVRVGGFAGRIRFRDGEIKIQHCYASGNVKAEGYGRIYAGGFVGEVTGNVSILSCYATGNVNATANLTDCTISAGGFAGEGSTFINCYALGDVEAEKSQSEDGEFYSIFVDYIGGFVGNIRGGEGLDRCFAKGNIKAERNIDFTSINDAPIYAGGLVGYVSSGEIKNSAALGTKIEVSGEPGMNNATGIPNKHSIGRVFGHDTRIPLPHETYAYNEMQFYVDGKEIREYVSGLTYPILSGNPVLEEPKQIAAPEAKGPLSIREYEHEFMGGFKINYMDISGITISDPNGIKSSDIPPGIGAWNGKDTITHINLDAITDKLDIDLNLLSITGSSSIYRITVSKVGNGFEVTGPAPISSSTQIHSITGLSITHPDNNIGIKSVFIKPSHGEWGNPVWGWTGTTTGEIAGLNLKNLQDYIPMFLELTITDTTNIHSVYRITISKDGNIINIGSPGYQSSGGIDVIGPGNSSRQHGESTEFSQFMSTSFWLGNKMNFNSATGGFGSLTNAWNFSRLYGKGHPILNGADGKPMPGQ